MPHVLVSIPSAFLAASVIIAVTPGPGVIYIVTRSATQGRPAGLAHVRRQSTTLPAGVAHHSCSKREVSHRAASGDTYTAHASNIKGKIVYFIVIQMAATAALLVGHFAVIVKNQLTRTR